MNTYVQWAADDKRGRTSSSVRLRDGVCVPGGRESEWLSD